MNAARSCAPTDAEGAAYAEMRRQVGEFPAANHIERRHGPTSVHKSNWSRRVSATAESRRAIDSMSHPNIVYVRDMLSPCTPYHDHTLCCILILNGRVFNNADCTGESEAGKHIAMTARALTRARRPWATSPTSTTPARAVPASATSGTGGRARRIICPPTTCVVLQRRSRFFFSDRRKSRAFLRRPQ